ncbi:MAG: IMP cyclohydrolase [Oscillospiraceae bacterium]|nr:IMP cyclohydrolase [Oscillospiraceae bacterium]
METNIRDIYEKKSIYDRIAGNPYVGRGICVGLSQNGENAVFAYFIMGRSANSRNRVFTIRDGELFTEPFDASQVEDPSLIIYAAARSFQNKTVVTNGDQTDTIIDGLKQGKKFSEALESRQFEPDAPNFTPRISAMLELGKHYSYQMSILKSIDADGSGCSRQTFTYPGKPGLGHFIHTYVTDGNPIPTFQGEPERIIIPDSIDEFTEQIWSGLDEANKISLYVEYINLKNNTGDYRLINKNQK